MTEPLHNRYLAVPPSGKGAGVLVLHAWWGLNDVMREFCDRLAQAGFVALAPDMFSGRVLRTIEEAEAHVSQLDWEHTVPPEILSGVEVLSKHPAVTGNGLATVGFSFGGFWALWLAQKKPELIRAVTLFYGTNGGGGDFTEGLLPAHPTAARATTATDSLAAEFMWWPPTISREPDSGHGCPS